ncbi:MAG: XRE family transcriptional regulator [Casimicrobium sp.]
MRANTPGFVGQRLTQARKSFGLTGMALAELLDVTPTTISQYEKGKQTPRPEVMTRLCELFKFPPTFFMSAVRDRGERNIMYRSQSVATKTARDRAEVRFEWFREIVEFLSEYFDYPVLNLPKVDLPADYKQLTREQIEAAASACRKLWGFGDRPIENVVLAMESNGIIVARGALGSTDLDAFSEQLPGDWAYAFLGDDKGVPARSRFDAAHELGHIILHRNARSGSFNAPKDFKLLEQQAHRFAAAFLLPDVAFSQSIWAPTLDAFRAQKSYWKVSIKGMIVRAHQIGMIGYEQYGRMMINYTRRFKDGEPGDDLVASETPRLIGRCFDTLLEQRILTREEMRAALPFPVGEIESLSSLPKGYLSAPKADVVSLPTLKKVRADASEQDGGNVVVMGRFRTAT